MSRKAARSLAVAALALALPFVLSSCESPSPEWVPPTGGSSSGMGAPCVGTSDPTAWIPRMRGAGEHVVDGAFGPGEWADATVLEGVLTDVYMDYREGRLYFLNDWRVNREGIRPDCFNYFKLRVGSMPFDLKVFGDGHVEVRRNGALAPDAAKGAYGFWPSPSWSEPHTIYEFSLAANAGQIDVCCFDPVFSSTCEVLSQEPVVFSMHAAPAGASMEVARLVPPEVVRLPVGGACGRGQGVCMDGSKCVEYSGGASCLAQLSPVAGLQADEDSAESPFEPVNGLEPAPPF